MTDPRSIKPRSSMIGAVLAVAFAVLWGAVVFNAVLHLSRTGAPLIAWLAVIGIGGFGLNGLVKSAIRAIRRVASGKTVELEGTAQSEFPNDGRGSRVPQHQWSDRYADGDRDDPAGAPFRRGSSRNGEPE